MSYRRGKARRAPPGSLRGDLFGADGAVVALGPLPGRRPRAPRAPERTSEGNAVARVPDQLEGRAPEDPARLPEPTYTAPGALEPLSDAELEEASRLRPCDVALLRAIAHGEVSLRGAASRIRALEVLSKRGHRRPKAFQRGTDPDALRPRILRLEAPAAAAAAEPEPGPATDGRTDGEPELDPNR